MLPNPLQHFKEKAEPLLRELEKVRDTKVFPILFSFNREISKPDTDQIYDALSAIQGKQKIDVILFSRGGDPDQAYLIGTILQESATKKLTIIIPRYAKSAATLITCAADEIIMLPASELGPIELMVESPETKRYVPVRSFIESIEMIAKMDLGEMKLGVLKEVLAKIPITELRDFGRLTEHMESLTEKLLSRRMFRGEGDKAKEVAKKLCEGYKSHTAPITPLDAKEIGLRLANTPENIKNLLWKLHKLWISTVVDYETLFTIEQAETFNFRIGRGIVFCTKHKREGKFKKGT
jgi:hypothetical protein